MLTPAISDLFRVRPRFLRSTYLERDFSDADALRGYVVTPTARGSMERLVRGLAQKSTQRAWRITGDYGTGKSSFALALAHLLAGGKDGLPADLHKSVDFRGMGIERPQLLPVLVTGSRVPAAPAILRGVARTLEDVCVRGRKPEIIDRLESAAEDEKPGRADAQLAKLLSEAAEYVQESGKGHGLLVVIDELGKFLEYAALHPDRQDVFFLQELAETAARSGKTPVVVVGLLHQGVHAYAEQLSLPAQKEWEKIAGRYDEILFDQPLEQDGDARRRRAWRSHGTGSRGGPSAYSNGTPNARSNWAGTALRLPARRSLRRHQDCTRSTRRPSRHSSACSAASGRTNDRSTGSSSQTNRTRSRHSRPRRPNASGFIASSTSTTTPGRPSAIVLRSRVSAATGIRLSQWWRASRKGKNLNSRSSKP